MTGIRPDGAAAAGKKMILALVAGTLATAWLCHPSWVGLPAKIAAMVGAGLLAYYGPLLDEYLERSFRARLLLALAWSALVTGLLLQDNLQAQWGVIDDHEIMLFLGKEGHLPLGDWAAYLTRHTELGSPWLYFPRYRPAYYFLRLTECFLWGNNPHLWYVAHLVIFGTSLAMAWNLMWRWLGSGAASLGMLYLLTYGFWGDIWCRLGPAEIYATWGTALYLTGAAAILRHARADVPVPLRGRLPAWSALALGAVVAMGSKENFLILLPATLALAAWLYWQGRLDPLGRMSTLLVAGAGVIITSVVVLAAQYAGRDIYGQNLSAVQRLQVLSGLGSTVWAQSERKMLLICLASLAGLVLYTIRSGRARDVFPCLWPGGVGLLALALLFVSQYVFYNGKWPCNSRYDFPGRLALPLLAMTLAWICLGICQRLKQRWQGIGYVGLSICLAMWVVQRGYGELRTSAQDNVERTRRFCQSLDEIAPQALEHPDRPIVFVSHRPLDYECAYSLRRFLRSRQVANPLFLRLEDFEQGTGNDLFSSPLTRGLQELSLKGRNRSPRECLTRLPRECFEPLAKLSDQVPLYRIDFLPGLQFQLEYTAPQAASISNNPDH